MDEEEEEENEEECEVCPKSIQPFLLMLQQRVSGKMKKQWIVRERGGGRGEIRWCLWRKSKVEMIGQEVGCQRKRCNSITHLSLLFILVTILSYARHQTG